MNEDPNVVACVAELQDVLTRYGCRLQPTLLVQLGGLQLDLLPSLIAHGVAVGLTVTPEVPADLPAPTELEVRPQG